MNSKRPIHSSPVRWLVSCLVAGAILLGACGKKESPPPTAEETAQAIQHRVDGILARSDAQTAPENFEYPDGAKGVRYAPKPRDLQLPKGSWSPSAPMDLATPGEIVLKFPLTDWPEDIAIDDSGTIVVASEQDIRQFRPNRAEPDLVSDKGARSLQWHPDGKRLLVSGPWQSALDDWPPGMKATDIQIAAPGLLQFSPDGQRLWSIQNEAAATDILSAGEAVRVRLRIDVYPFEGATTSTRTMQPAGYAMAGTLPAFGIAWGHEARPYQLDPRPAPLVLLDADLRPTGTITQTATTVDLDPQAGPPEFVYFIRALRRGGRSSRAWITSLHDGNLERPLTAEPTYDIAVSPGGIQVALLVTRGGEGLLLRTTREAVLARDIEPALAAQAHFQQQAAEALQDVREAFSSMEMGKSQKLGDWGWEVEWPPEDGLMIVMDAALRTALRDRAGLDLPDDFAALGQLDDFLAETDGLWPEEPATVVALAAVYGNVLASNPQVDWALESSLPALSYSMQDFTASDGLMYSLHSPFLVARERLQGRAMLDAAGRELLLRWERPVGLAENFLEGTLNEFLGHRAAEGGLHPGDPDEMAFEKAALHAPGDDIVQMLARSMALRYGDVSLETLTAFNLAENNPANGRALIMAAQAAQHMQEEEAALRLYDQAAKIAPDDLDVMLAVAIGYFDENRFDEAERLFLLVQRIDRLGLAREVVEENLKQLRALRDADEAEQIPAAKQESEASP